MTDITIPVTYITLRCPACDESMEPFHHDESESVRYRCPGCVLEWMYSLERASSRGPETERNELLRTLCKFGEALEGIRKLCQSSSVDRLAKIESTATQAMRPDKRMKMQGRQLTPPEVRELNKSMGINEDTRTRVPVCSVIGCGAVLDLKDIKGLYHCPVHGPMSDPVWQPKENMEPHIREWYEKRIAELEYEVKLRRHKAADEYWCWQGDGEDHLESLSCPVLIAPADLRALLPKAERGEDFCGYDLGMVSCKGYSVGMDPDTMVMTRCPECPHTGKKVETPDAD